MTKPCKVVAVEGQFVFIAMRRRWRGGEVEGEFLDDLLEMIKETNYIVNPFTS